MPEHDLRSESAGASSPVDPFESKMKLQVLLCEYTALRNMAVHRTNNIFQTIAVLAVLVSWAASRGKNDLLFLCVTVGALVVLFTCIWCIARDMYWAGKRVREIEFEINEFASEPLMVWKSRHSWQRYVPGMKPGRQQDTNWRSVIRIGTGRRSGVPVLLPNLRRFCVMAHH
jgi:hypothetical protein